MDKTELTHHGVPGMKWGVRRYQNKDGTLTPRGKKRYEKELKKLTEEERAVKNKIRTAAKLKKLEEKRQSIDELKKNNPDAVKDKKSKTETKPKRVPDKSIRDMSDKEVADLVKRFENEKKLNAYIAERRETKGQKFVNKVLKDVVEPVATDIAKDMVRSTLKSITDDKKKK